jgi:HTH-type transcriptional regulator/antitoxin HigA
MTKTIGKATPGSSQARSYLDLLFKFPPRPINSEADLRATQAVINSLLDQDELSQDEEDYLDVLGTLVADYEQTLTALPDIHGMELLKTLIAERNLHPQDLVSIFRTESLASDVLDGRCQLTPQHIQDLAAFFHISTEAFCPKGTALEF